MATEVVRVSDASRIYTVEELREMPVGAKFFHMRLGACQVAEGSAKWCGRRYMVFEAMYAPAGFFKNAYPWNLPMTRIA